jgi:membrane protease YdiL (CAAX protease family)
METVVAALGFAAVAVAWWLVGRGASVWTTVTPVLAAMGVAALLVGPPEWSADVSTAASIATGLAVGIALYLATRAFVRVVARWHGFRRHAERIYDRRGRLSLGAAVALSVALSIPGEELFWRGLVLGEARSGFGPAAAASLTSAWYVLANLPSANLAVVAAAVVGGAVWTALAWWSGGVLASLACHGVWTVLMLALPVVRAPAAVER